MTLSEERRLGSVTCHNTKYNIYCRLNIIHLLEYKFLFVGMWYGSDVTVVEIFFSTSFSQENHRASSLSLISCEVSFLNLGPLSVGTPV